LKQLLLGQGWTACSRGEAARANEIEEHLSVRCEILQKVFNDGSRNDHLDRFETSASSQRPVEVNGLDGGSAELRPGLGGP
jgi:hypothetical protein